MGWALVEGMEDPNLSIAKKAVVNIGYAPTFVGKVSTMNFMDVSDEVLVVKQLYTRVPYPTFISRYININIFF